MIVHNSAQTYGRSAVGRLHVGQRPARRNAWELPGGIALWKASAKIASGVFLVALVLQIGMGIYLGSLNKSVQTAENVRHELVDANISLLAKRASLQAPRHMAEVASKLLSLHKPVTGQVFVFSRAKGRFVEP